MDLRALESQLTACRRCPRLVEWREQVATRKRAAYRDWDYWAKPVPGFGDHRARILVVGLAPAAHGANRTGRMFTGDRSGEWLYRALHRAGLASQPEAASRHDGLRLKDVFVTAIVRCAPPHNQPTPEERAACRPWLEQEMSALTAVEVVVTLGHLAYYQVLRVYAAQGARLPRPRPRFAHGLQVDLGTGRPRIIASYHPSQQNTFTGRLTEEMLDGIFARAKEVLGR